MATARDAQTRQGRSSSSVAMDRLRIETDLLLRHGRLAVVFAGDPADDANVIRRTKNVRSWKSYHSVAADIAAALGRLGARSVELLPEGFGLPGALRERNIDFVWLNSCGVQGLAPAAHAPSILEMLGIPYVGHNPMTAALLDDKRVFKRHIAAIGLPTAPSITWHPRLGGFAPETDPAFAKTFADWSQGFIVKPVNGRASLHVHHVTCGRDLAEKVLEVYEATGNSVLIEGFLPGREFCVAVGGRVVRRGGQLELLGGPLIFAGVERIPEDGLPVFASMDVRPISRDRVRPLDWQSDGGIVTQLHDIAERLYDDLGLEALVRIDLRADSQGKLHILEANPKPDLRAPCEGVTSIIAEGLATAGLTYDDLIYTLLADRLEQLLAGARGTLARPWDTGQIPLFAGPPPDVATARKHRIVAPETQPSAA